MKKIISAIFLISYIEAATQQFQYDNTLYKTVYPQDLCKLLNENKGYVLLDVRSPGEYADTSSSPSFNMGHFRDAKNITINELSKRWRELEPVRDKPIFIYCSHSQRSRRASKMLADSGFTKIYNINGGITSMLKLRNSLPSCFNSLYESKVPYKILAPAQIIEKSAKQAFYIIDIRPDSVFNSISSYEKLNTLGRFASATHMLPEKIEANLAKIPKDKPILVVDSNGDESPGIAEQLMNLGYDDVSILFDGMGAWLENTLDDKKKNNLNWTAPTKYQLITGDDLNKLKEKNPSVVIIDTRNEDQFKNQSKNSWENIGHLKGAINIPGTNIDSKIGQHVPFMKTPVVLYTFSNQNEVYEAARKLHNMGYQNVNVLYGGIWNMRWSANNLRGKTYLKSWVVDIPEENL